GALHGVYLAVHRRLRGRSPRSATDPFTLRDVIPALVTFQLVSLAWIFFRADTFTQAFEIIRGLATLRAGTVNIDAAVLLVLLGAAALAVDLTQRNQSGHTHILNWPAPARGLAYGAMVLAVFVFAGEQSTPFIYFQF
ncbi:MAG: hypothetical protein HKN91_04070, partial [Acidimicrobiia bacterium]|nr:hypothetical protein [Acidimicrobiia bacterium]